MKTPRSKGSDVVQGQEDDKTDQATNQPKGKYTILTDKAVIKGVKYRNGDVVELTKEEAENHRERDVALGAAGDDAEVTDRSAEMSQGTGKQTRGTDPNTLTDDPQPQKTRDTRAGDRDRGG